MSVKQIASADEFKQLVASPNLTVVDFYATWCGPCKVIAPVVAQFASKYKDTTFAKVDVDQLQGVAQAQGVSAMPTFILFKGSSKVAEMRGANAQQLEALIMQHRNADGIASSTESKPYIPTGYHDINSCIDLSQLDCLNQKQDKTVKRMLKGESVLESDCDEQLLINLAFNQAVKIHSIKFVAANKDAAPKNIKLFANRLAMGFETAESDEATQVLELTEQDFDDATATALRFVKFQNVVSLTIFVQDNQGGEDTTIVKGLTIIGTPVETTKMGDLKPVGQEK
ncbi:hypothetical protein RI367_007677 [Sorochytrium milnesiophthora]